MLARYLLIMLHTRHTVTRHIYAALVDGNEVVGRLVDALVSKDAELAKLKRSICKLTAVLNRSVDYLTGDTEIGR